MKRILFAFALSFLVLSCSKNTTPNNSPFLSEGDILPQFTAKMSDNTTVTYNDYKDTVGLVLVYNIEKEVETINAITPVNELYKTYDEVFAFCCVNVSDSTSTKLWEQKSLDIPYANTTSGFPVKELKDETPILYFVNHGCIEKVWNKEQIPTSKELRSFMESHFHGIIIFF